jgi:hypothetical protein
MQKSFKVAQDQSTAQVGVAVADPEIPILLEDKIAEKSAISPLDSSPGVNGKLNKCQGDCDKDSDCNGDLKCFQRNNFEWIPGCRFSGNKGWDYCYEEVGKGLDSSPGDGSKNLDECQGDCDKDDDCKGNLVCFQRTKGKAMVPGCSGAGRSGWDYCINPIVHNPPFKNMFDKRQPAKFVFSMTVKGKPGFDMQRLIAATDKLCELAIKAPVWVSYVSWLVPGHNDMWIHESQFTNVADYIDTFNNMTPFRKELLAALRATYPQTQTSDCELKGEESEITNPTLTKMTTFFNKGKPCKLIVQ